jgi:serine protease Do
MSSFGRGEPRTAPQASTIPLMSPRSAALTLVVALGLLIQPSRLAAQTAPAPGLSDFSRSLQRLAERVSPAVVQIFVTSYGAHDETDRTATSPVFERGSGSGVIVDPDGYIVTNAHVVRNATRIEVELPFAATGGDPGRSILGRRGRTVGAQIVAVDEETDLAVIKVGAKALPVLPYGDSDALRPGQLVLAFGSPLGLNSSVTMGVVSAVARQLEPEDPMIYIQTDAPINPGNSGGALVDTEGRLVGINTLILSQSGGSEGIGFAAPSNIVRNIVSQITKHGRVRRGEIGVNAQTITPLLAEAMGLPVDTGVILADVAQGSPASKAGLKIGDLVVALNGKPMENGRQFRINVYTHLVGEQIMVDVRRGEQRVSVRVTVAERSGGTVNLDTQLAQVVLIPRLGISALDLTPAIAQVLPPVRRDKGAVIARVAPEAPFSQQGRLEAGDVVHTINGTPVQSAQELATAAAALKASAPVVLQIERDGVLYYVSFRIER